MLIAGGSSSSYYATCRLYDPSTGQWTVTGSLSVGRYGHSATLLPDGRVLVAGGYGTPGRLSSVEIYDPSSGTWSAGAPMNNARRMHTATLLMDGRVLVAGGIGAGTPAWEASAEIYDPATDSWTLTGSLATGRYRHTATLLRDGTVLVVAGSNSSTAAGALDSAERFDPSTGLWSLTGSLTTRRTEHSAVMLPNGRVLVTGGLYYSGVSTYWAQTAEAYDPATGVWSAAGLMVSPRASASATLLPSGLVLVVGGITSGGSYLASAELSGGSSWGATTPLPGTGRQLHGATLLPNGRVLITGGRGGTGYPGPLGDAWLYEYSTRTWAVANSMISTRSRHTTTLLPNNAVLAVGGSTSELYVGSTWGSAAALGETVTQHTATLLGDGRVLLAGGTDGTNPLRSARIYDPASNTWSPTGDMVQARQEHTATLLPCGRVLVTGGFDGTGPSGSAEVYDPLGGTWRAVAGLGVARRQHTATLLTDGRVLVAGGLGASGALASSEIFDPETGAWTPATGSLTNARYGHTATLLPTGQVLVVGGFGAAAVVARAEKFNPPTGTWWSGGDMATARWRHTATLLVGGRVLIEGGNNGSTTIATAELYDPAVVPTTTGTWTNLGAATTRESHSAVLLRNGRVLFSGGINGSELRTATILTLSFGTTGQPSITTVTNPLVEGSSLAATGTRFKGVSEASGGESAQGSASNYPLVQLRRLDNDLVRWLFPDQLNGWTDGTFSSRAQTGLQPGPSLVTVFTNGVPSLSSMITVECPAPTVSAPSSVTLCAGGTATFTVTDTGRCPAYQWRRAGAPLAEGGHYTGTTTSTLVVSPVDLGDAGDYDVVVASACSSTQATSAAATLAVDVQPPVTDLAVSAFNHASVTLSWSLVGAATYQVSRSDTSGGPYALVGSTSDGSYYDDTVASDRTYFYIVTVQGTCTSVPSNEVSVHTAGTADLSLSKTVDRDTVPSGTTTDVVYELTVTNGGPSTATGTQLVDTLPADATFVSSVPGAGTCDHSGPTPGGVVTCSLGDLASSGSIVVTIAVQLSGLPREVTNEATVSSGVADPIPGNNSASATTIVYSVVAGDEVPSMAARSWERENTIQIVAAAPASPFRTMIRYNTHLQFPDCVAPSNPGEGSLLAMVAGTAGEKQMLVHDDLTNDVTYCYSAFTYKGGGVFSFPKSVSGRPFDTSGRVKWSVSVGAAAMGLTGIGSDRVHAVGGADGDVHSFLKGTSGGGLWPSDWTPAKVSPNQGRPATVPVSLGSASRVIFVSSPDGMVYALDADRGIDPNAVPAVLPLWRQDLGTPLMAAPAGIFTRFGGIADDILLGTSDTSSDNVFYGLSLSDGSTDWTISGADMGEVYSQATVAYGPPARVYFTSQSRGGLGPTVWAVDLTTSPPELLWTQSLGDVDWGASLRNGRLYVPTNDGRIYVLDAETGASLWTAPPLINPWLETADGPVKNLVTTGRPGSEICFTTDNYVWKVLDNGTDYAVDAQRWLPSVSMPATYSGSDSVYVGGDDGRLYQLDKSDLSDRDVIPLGDQCPSCAVAVSAPTFDVAGGFLYVGTEAGIIYAVELQ